MIRQIIETAPDGQGIEEIGLENDLHQIRFLTIGARIASWQMGEIQILAPTEGVEHALTTGRHHASIVAPVANRIGAATAELEGNRLHFEANEGPNSLHSGSSGSQTSNWTVHSATSDEVVFTLEQKDGSGGFPGNRSLTVTWSLAGDTLSLDISATTDRPTFINPAFHPFFIVPEGTRVMVRSDEVVEIGEGKIPTGVIAAVDGTPYDLRQSVMPPDVIDHCYLIDGDLDEPCAVVDAPHHVLRVSTDAPGLQVFTGKPGLIAIEPEIHPDAPNHTGFPDIILRPGETFRQRSRWQVFPR